MQKLPRVTPATLDVLAAFVWEPDELHGFAIAQAVRRPTGSIYPILSRLERAGFLSSHWEAEHPHPGKPRRRLYRLSPDGFMEARKLLEARRSPSRQPKIVILRPSSLRSLKDAR